MCSLTFLFNCKVSSKVNEVHSKVNFSAIVSTNNKYRLLYLTFTMQKNKRGNEHSALLSSICCAKSFYKPLNYYVVSKTKPIIIQINKPIAKIPNKFLQTV